MYEVFYNDPICCGLVMTSINAYFLSNEVFLIETYAVLEPSGDLMNRLIHRSWGESF